MGKATHLVAAQQGYRTDANSDLGPLGKASRRHFFVRLGRPSGNADCYRHSLGLSWAPSYWDVIDDSLRAGRQGPNIARKRNESREYMTIDGYYLIAGPEAGLGARGAPEHLLNPNDVKRHTTVGDLL
jgi:hypothetical protein